MERMMPDDIDTVLYREHTDRYRFISPLLYGAVLDVACGIGYGSAIVLESSAVKNYSGVDIEVDAIQHASSFYEHEKASFSVGDITQLNAADSSYNTVISFETLEHLENPSLAVGEVSRVLTADGFWLGSVPANQFDDKCEQVYGHNPYHITRFAMEDLIELLEQKFEYVRVFLNYLSLGSMFLDPTNKSDHHQLGLSVSPDEFFGSFLFVATNDFEQFKRVESLSHDYSEISSLVEYDELRVKPLRKAFVQTEALVEDRTQSFKTAEKMIQDRDELISAQDKRIAELAFEVDTLSSVVEKYQATRGVFTKLDEKIFEIKKKFKK